jgi:hypothetical protein
MDMALENSASALITNYFSFNDQFNMRINLPPLFNLWSFAVPARITLSLERILEQKMDTRTDLLNLRGSLGFSSINMFGSLGYSPVFSFYQSDEYTHVLDLSVIIPRDEDIIWRFQSSLSASFMGFSGGLLRFTNMFVWRSNNIWTNNFIADWETPTQNSLLSVFYDWIVSQISDSGSWLTLTRILNSDYQQLRKESLEVTFDNSLEHLRWTITAGHEEIVRILGRLNFSAFVKVKFGQDFNRETFFFDTFLGTALRISF